MLVELINPKKSPLSLEFFSKAVCFLERSLVRRKVLTSTLNKKLILIFLSESSMKKLNSDFLKKSRSTDVLSFSPMEDDCLGELALSKEKIKKQSEEHNLSFEEETIYLVLHGLLHLLGYHHEKGGAEARKMFKIQDSVFQEWRDQFKGGSKCL